MRRTSDAQTALGMSAAVPAATPKCGPCGITRAYERPDVIFVESCEAGVHSINDLKERLLADFGVLLPHAGTFVQRTGSSASAAHVFIQDLPRPARPFEGVRRKEWPSGLYQMVCLLGARSAPVTCAPVVSFFAFRGQRELFDEAI